MASLSARRTTVAVLAGACALIHASSTMLAQGRGGAEWTTSGGDAQRTSWVRSDPRISVANMQKPLEGFGPFKFLWKLKVDNDPRPYNPLTQPVLLDRIVGFRGFKSIAFVGTNSGTVYAIDTDFGTELWKVHLNYGASLPPITTGTPACPGGLTAAATRPTALSVSAFVGGGGGLAGRGGRSGGGVGEAGRGAPSIYTAGQGRGAGAPAAGGAPGLPTTPGTPAPGSAAAAAQAGRAGGGGGGGGRGQMPGAPDAAYVIGNDGYVRALNIQSGWELFPPAQFLPANTRPVGPIVVNDETTGFFYVATTQGCAYTPDGVWAVDLVSPKKEVVKWEARGATIAGSMGPTLGRDGTIYVATTDGSSPLSNSIVALEPKTLKQKAALTQAKADFVASPILFQHKDRDLLAALGRDGRIYIIDGALKTPLAVTPAYVTGEATGAGLASWEDAQATRWILAPIGGPVRADAKFGANGAVTNGTIAAFKLIEDGSGLSLQPGWVSRDLTAPATPMIVNGVVFALSTGERPQRSTAAVLYALDGASGKELWSSGKIMTASSRGGLSGGAGFVYVPSVDSTLYAFGFPIEK
jgi:outer membrane protein assembly factor BamB